MPDQKKNKSLYSNSILIFLVRFFANLATLWVMYYFSHNLAREQNGTYLNFWTRLSLTSGIAGLGFSLFIFTYPPDTLRYLAGCIRKRYYLFYAAFLVGFALLFAWLQEDRALMSFLISFGFFIIYILNILLESLLMVLRKYRLLLPVSIIYSVVFVGIHIFQADAGFVLPHLLAWLLPLALLKLVIVLPPVISFFRLPAGNVMPRTELKRIRSLWMHLSFFNLYSVLFQWIDKYVLTFVVSAALSAVYFNGSVAIPFLPLVFGAVSSALLMQMNTITDAESTSHKLKLLHYSSGLLSSVAFPVFCFLFVFAKELIVLMFSEQYLASVPVFLCAILVIPVRSFDFVAVLQHCQKGRIINFGAAMDLVLACALMYPLYRLFGLPGVALSFVLSTYGQCLFYLYYSGKAMNVSMWAFIPWSSWLLKLLIFGALALTLHWIFTPYSYLLRVTLSGVVIAAAALVSLRYEYNKQVVEVKKE